MDKNNFLLNVLDVNWNLLKSFADLNFKQNIKSFEKL